MTSTNVYQFTPRHCDRPAGPQGPGRLIALRTPSAPATPTIYSGAWYHEAALREERAGKA